MKTGIEHFVNGTREEKLQHKKQAYQCVVTYHTLCPCGY